jgi:hypothetical protein
VGQSAEQDHFDLLPFIAIMMCLLGTLLLVTMSMAAINIGAGAGEGWVPAPDPGAKIPVLIEWDGRDAVWHSETGLQRIPEDFTEFVNFGSGWIRFGPDGKTTRAYGPEPNALDPLVGYLEARRKTHYALFAVRPSGFSTFRRFASRFEDRKIDVGSEPIEQGKSVRLVLPKGSSK